MRKETMFKGLGFGISELLFNAAITGEIKSAQKSPVSSVLPQN